MVRVATLLSTEHEQLTPSPRTARRYRQVASFLGAVRMTILLEQPRSDTKSPLSPVTHVNTFKDTALPGHICTAAPVEVAQSWQAFGPRMGKTSGSQQQRDILIFGDGKGVGGQSNMKRSNISPGCLHMTIGEQVSGEPCAPHVRASSPHDPADHVSYGTKSTSVLWAPWCTQTILSYHSILNSHAAVDSQLNLSFIIFPKKRRGLQIPCIPNTEETSESCCNSDDSF